MRMRTVAVLVGIALTLALAGLLWAEYGEKPMPTTGGMRGSGQNEPDRCSMTCAVLMRHWNRQFAAMKAHEGDKQCWDTCWQRFGDGSDASASEMKATWMGRMGKGMRANQCAQACWRKFHEDSNTVEVGGWRSMPRTVVCTP